jgi:ureidoacrylate peracid hydrolase
MGQTLSREVPVVPTETTLLFVDVQNYCAHRDGSEWKGLAEAEREARLSYFFEQLETHVVPNMQRLQTACRRAGVEVMYTVIQSLTRDGRDRSLDYKITGFNVPRGSWDGKVIDAIAPGEDEIVIPKTSSSVFISTNIDYCQRRRNFGATGRANIPH